MIELIEVLLLAVIDILPDSPFQTTLDGEIYSLDFLPYLNWFIPFDNCLTLVNLWISAIVIYYSYNSVRYVLDNLIISKLGS